MEMKSDKKVVHMLTEPNESGVNQKRSIKTFESFKELVSNREIA